MREREREKERERRREGGRDREREREREGTRMSCASSASSSFDACTPHIMRSSRASSVNKYLLSILSLLATHNTYDTYHVSLQEINVSCVTSKDKTVQGLYQPRSLDFYKSIPNSHFPLTMNCKRLEPQAHRLEPEPRRVRVASDPCASENRCVVVTEAGSYLRLIDFCITELKAQGPSRTCNESKEEEEESVQAPHPSRGGLGS